MTSILGECLLANEKTSGRPMRLHVERTYGCNAQHEAKCSNKEGGIEQHALTKVRGRTDSTWAVGM